MDDCYDVYVRLPYPRNAFIDPPAIDWSRDKERQLWTILSRYRHRSDIDWKELATLFNTPTHFLLQQAALLYERELSQVREQMRRVGSSSSLAMAPSRSRESSQSGVGIAVSDVGVGSMRGSRAVSSSTDEIFTVPIPTAMLPSSSRASTSSFRPAPAPSPSPAPQVPILSFPSSRRASATPTPPLTALPARLRPPSRSGSGSGSGSSLSDSLSRLPREPPAFLPLSEDEHDTDINEARPTLDRQKTLKAPTPDFPRPTTTPKKQSNPPSIGSSFSDLSDASVSVSAMEDALISQAQAQAQGQGQGSKLSIFSGAGRSRYVP
ncbi:hypothetical protein SAICODRAFT_67690 [Saitoella complicata NRRL Y-17804]|uniref:uncharacterized protein n=1 Tax=Saitoella complicata (strain BCRC 22490 / CBS 7301 / JCM 7358 / NBRC 10748 / NRRL Y-17804) TaxID=698492 RepID=UPI0008671952|nr:uncharacterized protein SAICODRAFT_67690 [Saitoella complicata NRRL Y-17804]ODQ50609.1 hypothetical protein SAICODRAFT_67690 [Saitoella complicata NRRL Y-17804]